jgi:hypothetical protein
MLGNLHSEFVILLFLQTHRETDRFFSVSGVQLAQSNRDHFHYHHSPITLSDFSSINLVFILTCSSPPRHTVYVRHVDFSTLVFSLSSHRHSYISLHLALDLSFHNKQQDMWCYPTPHSRMYTTNTLPPSPSPRSSRSHALRSSDLLRDWPGLIPPAYKFCLTQGGSFVLWMIRVYLETREFNPCGSRFIIGEKSHCTFLPCGIFLSYNNRPFNDISFMSTLVNTSGRLHFELVRIFFFRLIEKTTNLVTSGVHLTQSN